MTKNFDMFWMSNDAWWRVIKNKDGTHDFVLTDDAPEEAKKSFAHYQKQCEEHDKKYL